MWDSILFNLSVIAFVTFGIAGVALLVGIAYTVLDYLISKLLGF